MKIAIMGAMPEEVAPILEILGEYNTVNFADNKYYEANYKGVDVVVAYSKIGKVFSTLTAAMLIEHFGCNRVLFSGVAGAVNPNLKVGDLIIATQLCQHDLDITAFGHPHGYVPEGSVCVDTDRELISIGKKVAKQMGKGVHEGIIATGDQFVADELRKNWIGDTFDADALEMEGASVAVTCNALKVPFFILRAISDAADMDASFSFDEFLETSAVESAEFVMKMVDEIVG